MNRILKIILIVLLILLVIAILLSAAIAILWSNISFPEEKFNFSSADLSGLSFQDIPAILLSGEERTISVNLEMVIKNDNNISIPFCYLTAKFFYEGTEIATTSDQLAKTCYRVPANGELPVSDTITIKLNPASAKLLLSKSQGQKPVIQFITRLTVFGVPIPRDIKGEFPWSA